MEENVLRDLRHFAYALISQVYETKLFLRYGRRGTTTQISSRGRPKKIINLGLVSIVVSYIADATKHV